MQSKRCYCYQELAKLEIPITSKFRDEQKYAATKITTEKKIIRHTNHKLSYFRKQQHIFDFKANGEKNTCFK